MTDSVWWYVLAGFLLGFILSTLWEWLYFRRRRMRIENQRIAELEATVHSLSTISQSAETNTSPGFAAGYQSPMVFLEGEEDDVDTVEVIVPASPEPVDFDQSIASQAVPVEQQRSDPQFAAARSASIDRASASNGNGVLRQAPGQAPGETPKAEPAQSTLSPAALAVGTAAAAAIWTRNKEQPTVSPYVQEQPVTAASTAEMPAAEIPVAGMPVADVSAAEPPVSETPVSEPVVYAVPAEQRAEEQIAQEHVPGLVGDLAPSKQANYVSTTSGEAERASTPVAAATLASADLLANRSMPLQPQDEVAQIQAGAAPQATATSTTEVHPTTQDPNSAAEDANAEAADQVTVQPAAQAGEGQPVLIQPVPQPAEPAQPGRQKPEEDSGLTPAGVAVLVSALASRLAGEQQRSPEASQPPPQAETADPQAIPESAPAARVVPVVYTVPDTLADTQADTQDAPQEEQGILTGLDSEQNTDPAAQPGSSETATEAQYAGAAASAGPDLVPAEAFTVGPAAVAADPGRAPQDATAPGPDSPLPLSAILPRAAKPAPLNKSGPARRPEAAQASALAASGIEPEIEQVSNQLDDLIESINGLIEKTQPLLNQPPSEGQALSAEPPAAPAPLTAESGYNTGEETGTDENADTGVTGPYSAQNLSRMEYGLVQLLQAARRLGRDVRSAF